MAMQVTVDGVELDNNSWRYVLEETGDDIGLDNQRALAIDFVIQADTTASLQERYAQTREDFIKSNIRAVFTHDDSASTTFADVSPGDGIHTDVRCTIGIVSGKAQTGHRYYCRLYVLAGVQIPNAPGGAVPGSGDTTYAGLTSSISRKRMLDAGGIESRTALLTFGTTYNGTANGPYTLSSVEDSGGKAVFVVATTPVAFSEGMRLEVSGSSAYNGVHLITAINTTTKKITTDTTFGSTDTGTVYVGDITTGQENYDAAKSTIFTDLMGVESDGSRDATTGLKLTKQMFEDNDELGKQLTVMLESREDDDVELTGVNNADRGFEISIGEVEPDTWNPKGGTTPRLITVTGSCVLDKDLMASGTLVLHQLFNSTILPQIKSHMLTQTGYAAAKLRSKSFESQLSAGRLGFQLIYQVRNLKTITYKSTDRVQTEDDVVSWKAGKYDYEQRQEGLPPRTIARTVVRTGWNKVSLKVPTPAGDAPGATYRAGPSSSEMDTESSPDGLIYIQSKTQIFVRRVYEGGSGGRAGVVAGGLGGTTGTGSGLTA